jgi:lipopolysaccharide transport system permease protein
MTGMPSIQGSASPSDGDPVPTFKPTVIRPRKGWQGIDFEEMWRFRDLVWILTFRDVRVRYKQSVLGIGWSVFRPAIQVLVFTLFFGQLMRVSEQVDAVYGAGTAYAVFALSGQVVWTFFNGAINSAAQALHTNARIIRKVYLPKLVLPLAGVGTPVVDGAIVFGLLLVVMGIYQTAPSWWLLTVPVLVLVASMGALGLGLVLGAASVWLRDVRLMIPFMVQTLFFVTPVIYPSEIVPESTRWVYYLNPAAGVIDFLRAGVFAQPVTWMHVQGLGISALMGAILLAVGLAVFMRAERDFADVA